MSDDERTAPADDEEPASWSAIAGWYDQLVAGGSGPHQLATATTLELLPRPGPASVLDVACGQGIATRAIARTAPASSVVGVDLTPELLARAQAYEAAEPLGIEYHLDDARTLATVADGSIDAACCQLALMDIDDLDATVGAAHRVLRPSGALVVVIGHPCFLAPNASTLPDARGREGRFVNDYFHERFWRSPNPHGVRRVGNHHRTVSTYLNALIAAGFAIDHVAEPRAGELLAEQQPVYRNVPIFLAVRARRA